jgi:CubicO group peptidase (beta-lactamase class C family)
MTDTSFVLPPGKLDRLTSMYAPTGGFDGKQSFALEMTPGLQRIDSAADSEYLKISTYPAGGSGLLSTANDYFRFAQMLVNGGELGKTRLLSSKTVELMTSAHVPAGFPGIPDMLRGSGYGLGVSVAVDITAMANLGSVGQFGWSGAASTHVIMDPRENLVAILLVQYRPSLLPLRKQFQTLVYQALSARK